ncbi:MAG: ABC transporter permease [Planctomycetes bacterium]|nr:ABC transporter permease [Planctomycetota bacterium]
MRSLLRQLLRRLLLFVPTLLGITVATFVISRAAPGGPLGELSAEQGSGMLTREQLAEAAHARGFDRPLVEQYFDWLGSAVRGDFGNSDQPHHRPVRELIGEAARVTIGMQAVAAALIYLLGVPIGVWCAVRVGTRLERWVSGLLFALYAMPSVVVGSFLIALLCTGTLANLPFLWSSPPAELTAVSRAAHVFANLAMPTACLVLVGLTGVARYTRAGMVETLRQPWIRALRARGLPESRVLYVHALRTGILPVVTLVSSLFPWLVSGSVAIETLFSIPGLGRLAFEAVDRRDYATVQALALLIGVMTMVGFLVSDLLHAALRRRERVA